VKAFLFPEEQEVGFAFVYAEHEGYNGGRQNDLTTSRGLSKIWATEDII
jgi:hypothetical protein